MTYHPTTRVLTVLELLQTHGRMRGRELAQRLEVDVRTVRRYIVMLQEMGIPIEAEYGREGGYVLRPGYKLPPLMFTDDEVLVLTLGLLLARRSTLRGAGISVERSLAKIARVLPFNLRDRLQAIQDAMHLDTPDDPIVVEGYIVATLTHAASEHRCVRIDYAARRDEPATQRDIDPYGVVNHQGHWYTVAYCHLRQELRTFRLDRIISVSLLERPFVPPPNFDALEHLLSSFEAIPDEWTVDVRLYVSIEQARQQIPRAYATLTPETENKTAEIPSVRLRASIRDLDQMARTLLALGCSLEILAPDELRESFRRLGDAAYRIAAR